MQENKVLKYIEAVVENLPSDWLNLTTHRLDIYNEALAKTEFTEQFEALFNTNNAAETALNALPTAYDYIRLGHPISSVLEWTVAKLNGLKPQNVISFSSRTVPILAVLRKNLLANKKTQIVYTEELPSCFDVDVIKNVYRYNFELKKVTEAEAIPSFNGSTIFISQQENIGLIDLNPSVDFYINLYAELGSILIVNGEHNESYISEIQHVRRRETIAMTPVNCHAALKRLLGHSTATRSNDIEKDKALVADTVNKFNNTETTVLLGSSGLSIQYAIMMGLIHYAQENHKGKDVRFIIPPNCYGGTNDQARRVAACIDHVEILDLPVDRDNNMVDSLEKVLAQVAMEDAVPYIIVEIPTNPRVEVPDLDRLKDVLIAKRKTSTGTDAITPVFIIDQTFCPNLQFLKDNGSFSSIKTMAYISGSKFPSGGKCTAGYCLANKQASVLIEPIAQHLKLCDNEATELQTEILAEQMPSMNDRISAAYKNTREFVNFIKNTLPSAKINFVSEELAEEGFTPSVFSLDLPTKGATVEERELYKRALNNKLINLMINEIPHESKYCVSYGQLKGCYWTIPATSTQGTTKEGDKDYIARVALSPKMDLERHKEVFLKFVEGI